MSEDGGGGGESSGFSSGSGGKGGGNSSGALGKGGGGSDSGMGFSAPVDTGSPANAFAPTGVGASSGLPPEIGAGSSGGFDWSMPSISASDLNLDGSGPVGGGSGLPDAGGGINTFGGSGVMTTGDANPANAVPFLDTGGQGTGVGAFAAPTGVAGGSPDLSDLTKTPTDVGSAAQTGAGSSVLDSLKGGWGGSTPTSVSSTTSSGGDKGIMDSLGIKPTAGTALAGAGLINSLIQGNKPPAGTDAMSMVANNATSIAGQQNEAGKALQQYISTGTLPAGYESQVQAQVNAAKAKIISNYASRGMPTDPSRNSTLAQELNQIDGQVPAMREQMAKTLSDAGSAMVTAGLTATGISSNVFQNLAKMAQDQQNNRATAIANFAGALNGGTKGNSVNLKLG